MKFSQYISEEVISEVPSPFDDVEEQSILRIMEPEKVAGMGDRPVYLVYRGRVGNWLAFRFADDSNGNEYSDALSCKHFHRRERDVIVDVNKIPSWFSKFDVVSNLEQEQAKSFK